MGEAIGQILPLAAGVALSPVPIVGVVALLGTAHGRVNGNTSVIIAVLCLAIGVGLPGDGISILSG